MNRQAARYDSESRKLIVAGSWIPLLAILGIFAVRYAMGVARALEFDIAQDRNVQLAVSLLLGAFSGIFLARALVFWRTHAARPVERPSASRESAARSGVETFSWPLFHRLQLALDLTHPVDHLAANTQTERLGKAVAR